MPTPLDKALQSRHLFFGFAGIVTLASLWSIWGGDMLPAEKDPTGDPDYWTETELRRWLKSASHITICRSSLTVLYRETWSPIQK
ncbi:hypothetical protein HRR77_008449 [Exophiala dermatitidis]|nr:hypothetical protein HRR77_008449 [Exophiala dermatitidis]KAJ4560435.1 hypothetical protein HRR79_008113 [Exophiala dermatitidis]KAJ4603709.1 hypothetical protein HRR85_008522 [Exophiala dermatitidis]